MKLALGLLVGMALQVVGASGGEKSHYNELVFEDDFSGGGFGEKWKHYKSASVVADGVLAGITSPDSDHQAVDTIRFEGRRDMEIALKFKFTGPDAKRFNLKFDDHQYKGSHAGHICRAVIARKWVVLSDGKTGNFENSIFEMKKSPQGLDEKTRELLKTKSARFAVDLDDGEWHRMVLRTRADKMVLEIDGGKIGELQSGGIAHSTKSSVGMATPGKGVFYDDFVVRARSSN